jgi:DNA-binding NtrC family response regulator
VLTTPTALGTRVALSWQTTRYIVQKINLETKMKTDTDTLSKFTVLLVDDDDKFRTQLAQYLRDDGFQIVEANSSSEACAFIRERKVSLVVLDWDLHKVNSSPEHPSTGLKILQTCHEVDALLPVVVMSGARHLDGRDDSMMAGADCFLQKPFALLLMSVHLRRWMGRVKAEKNPFTQLTAGVIETADAVNRAYTRAVVERVGSASQAAPKLGLSRQTVASYLASPSLS